MLILSRKTGESIIIGNDITLTVLSIKGPHVRIGIDAPKKLPVHREEVYERIQKENESANNNECLVKGNSDV